jgi:hypothetical protein
MPKKNYKPNINKRGRPPKFVTDRKIDRYIEGNIVDPSKLPKFVTGKYDKFDPKQMENFTKAQIIYLIASLGGSQADCGRYAGITQPAVRQNYHDVYFSGKADIKMRIRCAQLQKALEGDSNLLKHLGITYCEDQRTAGLQDIAPEELKGIIEILAGGGKLDGEEDEIDI